MHFGLVEMIGSRRVKTFTGEYVPTWRSWIQQYDLLYIVLEGN